MVGDKISQLIISLKNASCVKKDNVLVEKTKINLAILEVLKNNSFVESFEINDKSSKINVVLKYNEKGIPAITDVKRMSKLSRRVYKKYTEVFPVKNGYGIAVLTTPQGVMSDKEAREKKVGGELMFQIW
jgi:small subunit ribosomal protein S8